jgi:hypothetical protein
MYQQPSGEILKQHKKWGASPIPFNLYRTIEMKQTLKDILAATLVAVGFAWLLVAWWST